MNGLGGLILLAEYLRSISICPQLEFRRGDDHSNHGNTVEKVILEIPAESDRACEIDIPNKNLQKESNWLPAPEGRFIPMLRLYWPKEKPPSILDGTWEISAVKKVL